LSFTLKDKPAISSMNPETGGTAGGTDVVILGSGFLPGSTATLDDQPLLPDGGIRVSNTMISGYTPAAREAGTPRIVVHTPMGDASAIGLFRYKASPVLLSIWPDHGPPSGGTGVTISGANFGTNMRVYLGATLDEAVALEALVVQGTTSIIGVTPAGSGTTTVWAVDDALGFAKLRDGFTWGTP
jgi:hypothetical protein